MASGILYLDIDDEITSAAARIRAVEGSRVAIVLPYGSRVATSRINFRLLARDALTHQKRLSIVAGDAATRALAASAGIATFASVGEYEESLPASGSGGSEAGAAAAAGVASGVATGADPADSPVAADSSGTVAAATPETPEPAVVTQATLDELETAELAAAAAALKASGTPPTRDPAPALVPPVRPAPSADTPVSSTRAPARAVAGSRTAAGRTTLAVGGALIALVAIVGLVGAWLLLPAATIVVTPKEETVGPVVMTIVADPTATEPDPAAGVVPAETISVDATVSDTFPATGKRVERSRAHGQVRFRNKNFLSSNTIPAGSIVSTPQGVRFKTDDSVTVPRADLVGTQVFPKTASVAVTAVEAGPDGNVPANAILVIPPNEDPIALDVTNPDETSGGNREEFPKVTQDDIDAALAALGPQLDAAFREQLADPDVADPGMTVFPETGVLGTATPSPDPTTLVDQEVETFELGLSATGTATAVDEAPVTTVAEERVVTEVDPGHELVPDSVSVTVDPAVVSGGQVSFPATATARQVAILDPAALEAEVAGKPVEEARTILERYGAVELSTWPGWVTTIPTIDARVDLTVATPVPVETPAPSASP